MIETPSSEGEVLLILMKDQGWPDQNWKVTPPLARQVVPRSLAQNSMPPRPYSFTETPLKF